MLQQQSSYGDLGSESAILQTEGRVLWTHSTNCGVSYKKTSTDERGSCKFFQALVVAESSLQSVIH